MHQMSQVSERRDHNTRSITPGWKPVLPTRTSHRFRRRSQSSSPDGMLTLKKKSGYEVVASLLNMADILRAETTAVYSSIMALKQNGDDLENPETFGDHVIFQLTEWQRNADLIPQFGNLISHDSDSPFIQPEMIDHGSSSEIQLILKNVLDSLRETLFEVNNIITQIPSIRFIFGPMVYNIKATIDEVYHRSQLNRNVFQDPFSSLSEFKFEVEEDPSRCFTLNNIKHFC